MTIELSIDKTCHQLGSIHILDGFYLLRYEFFSSPDGQKAMHMSPPCISTGGLKQLKTVRQLLDYDGYLGAEMSRCLGTRACSSCLAPGREVDYHVT